MPKCDFNPANIYLFKVNNKNIRESFETCSKLTVKTPERRQWCRSGVSIVHFEQGNVSREVASQIYWKHISTWVFSKKFAAYFQNNFYVEHLWMAASEY